MTRSLVSLLGLWLSVTVVPPSARADDVAWDKIIGADTKTLNAAEKHRVQLCLTGFQNTHGCTGTLAECLAKGDMTARRHAGFVVRMVKKGKDDPFIKKYLVLRNESAHPEKPAQIELLNHPQKGKQNAEVVLVEYACFECPFCAHLAPALKTLDKKFGAKLVQYFKYFPVRSHPRGVPAAVAAAAAHLQGKFWPMYDRLFENRAALEEKDLVTYAEKVGLNIEKWQQDRKAPSLLKIIEQDKLEGMRLGVDGTPTFFINGKMFKSVYDIAELEDRIAEEIDIIEGRIP